VTRSSFKIKMTPAFGFNTQTAAAPDALASAGFIITAFILSGTAHVLWLHSAASMRFASPVDCGMSLFGKRIFGEHKMLRGFVVMVPASSAAFFLLFLAVRSAFPDFASRLWPEVSWRYAAAGAWAGFGFMAGELPNSFVKRRLNILPGPTAAHPAARCLCFAADRLDSILGMLAALSVVVSVPALTWLYVVVLGAGIHWTFSAALFVLGVKERMS